MERILLAHGGGGLLTKRLIDELVVKKLANPILEKLDDSAQLRAGDERLAFTTDSFVVKPIFFRGGDIGSLSVYGTVNDLAMAGAVPLYLSLSFIIEEGLALRDFKRILASIAKAARTCGVQIVTGDTKVVERGSADGVYVNTAGVGKVAKGVKVGAERARAGDVVMINGYVGDHGIAVISEREGLAFETPVKSDARPLNGLISDILRATKKIHVLRDPTRGGLAVALNDIAEKSQVSICVHEEKIPVRKGVASACDMLGLDVLLVANEGKVIVICPAKEAEKALEAMRGNSLGKKGRIIGEVIRKERVPVTLRTRIGSHRILDVPTGEQLPRIC
jgi:hydrogenase expression/formation protein HypE